MPSQRGGRYECGTDHQAGEDAHWPPFQAAAAEYINQQLPWDTATEKLVGMAMSMLRAFR